MIVLDGADTEEKSSAATSGPGTADRTPMGLTTGLLTQLPGGDEMPPPEMTMTREKWKDVAGEDSPTFAELAKAPSGTGFSRMEPGQFSPPRESSESGAPLIGAAPAVAHER